MVMNCQLHKMAMLEFEGYILGLQHLYYLTLICEKFPVELTGLVLRINV